MGTPNAAKQSGQLAVGDDLSYLPPGSGPPAGDPLPPTAAQMDSDPLHPRVGDLLPPTAAQMDSDPLHPRVGDVMPPTAAQMDSDPLHPRVGDVMPPTADDSGAAVPRWGILEILLGSLFFVFVLLCAGIGFWIVRFSGVVTDADLRTTLQSLLGLMSEAALFLPVWIFAVMRRKGGWSALGFRRVDLVLGVALPLAYLIVAFAGETVWGAVIQFMKWDSQQSIEKIFGDGVFGVMFGFATAVIVAPIAEETFFRGFVIGGLRRRFGTAAAVLLSALLFTLPHPPVTIYPIIFLLGILLALLYVQTKSLWPGILLHALFNGVAFVAQFFIIRPT